MFLPVACLKCGKLFQVPEAAAGTEVACPYCKQSTAALPVASTAPTEAPLSLDDAEPTERQREKKRRTDSDQPIREPKNSARPALAKFAIGGVLIVVVLVGTVGVLRYGSGEISPVSWAEFTPPDGSCSIHLPGTPDEEVTEPRVDETVTRGLHLYTTTGWYSRARVWIGWRDLDPAWVKQAKEDRDGAITNPILTAERDRRKAQVGGTVTKEATVRFGPNLGLEVWMDTPRRKLVERYVAVLEGPRPRLYLFGIEAKNATAHGEAAQKLFNSFRTIN